MTLELDTLPNIFSFIGAQECTTLSLVCSSWNSIIQNDNILWRDWYFSKNRPNKSTFKNKTNFRRVLYDIILNQRCKLLSKDLSRCSTHDRLSACVYSNRYSDDVWRKCLHERRDFLSYIIYKFKQATDVSIVTKLITNYGVPINKSKPVIMLSDQHYLVLPPLHLAAYFGHGELVKLLIDHGAATCVSVKHQGMWKKLTCTEALCHGLGTNPQHWTYLPQLWQREQIPFMFSGII
jgi:hypothetical protein